MFKEIELQLADGTKKSMPFLANATTAIRYRQLFQKELLGGITGIFGAVGPDRLLGLVRIGQEAEAMGDELTLENVDGDTLQTLLSIAGSGELNTISQMAFIMNRQAERAEMGKLSLEQYLDWLEQFESMEFLTKAMDFIGLYMSNRAGTSAPKKDTAQRTER